MKLRMFGVLLLLVFGVIGCALLQEAPPIAIPASRLSCAQNPEMVDGDLSTVGTFAPKGSIKKEYVVNFRYAQRQYQRRVIGSLKTETLIKLDAPTYIKYIEVYPASTIPNFALDTTPEERSPKWTLSFTAVEDKRAQKVEGSLPVRFQIQRKVLYLRLTANALEDADNVSHGNEIGELRIPLKGASIREVKFFEQQ
ncbi:MAG: hypothetical protein OXI61_18280 [Candidatus Poribacteria bacterium]|nr:hypothetical protein [Candidatus Poribacteria bacterium]